MKNIVPRILAAALVMLGAVAAGAQTKPAKAAAASKTAQVAPSDDLQQFRQNFIKAAEDYRASLQELAASYDASLQKVKDQQEKLKGLYADGLIARVEFEASEKAVADAQAKVEDLHKQLAEADETLAAARKPVEPVVSGATFNERTDIAWTTGSARVDGLIRLNGKRFGVDPYLLSCLMTH